MVEQGGWNGDDLDMLEASLSEGGWVHDFEEPTLADVCWYAAVRHVLSHDSADVIAWLMKEFAQRPSLKRWWQMARDKFERDNVSDAHQEKDDADGEPDVGPREIIDAE